MWAGFATEWHGVVGVPDQSLQASDRVRHGERLALVSLGLVMVAVFGPYTPIGGTRTEQLAVYGCLLGPLLVNWMRICLSGHGWLFLFLWGAYFAVALVQGVVGTEPAAFLPGQWLHGADNLLRPLAVFLLASLWLVTSVDRSRMLRLACGMLVIAMTANTFIAFIQSQVDISQWISPFWSSVTGDVTTDTVAGRAAQLGRFTGVINQPAEAGTLYGMAVLAAIYLWHRSPKRLILPLTILSAGGVLTVSKIFLFGALPIAVWQVATLPGPRKSRIGLVALAAITASAALLLGILPDWPGSAFLAQLANPTGNYLTFFTANRYGSDTSLTQLVGYVLSTSPWTGFGLQGLATAYDSGWVEALVFAGLIGVIAYTGVLVVLLHAWWTRRRLVASDEAKFAGGLVLLAIGASAGFPALTGNRVTTVLWVLLTLMLMVPLARESRRDPLILSPEAAGARAQPRPSEEDVWARGSTDSGS